MKTIEELNNKGLVKIEELKQFAIEWVNYLEEKSKENKELLLPNLHISSWIIKNFSLTPKDLGVELSFKQQK